ncbi:hypothetical protein C2869_21010 [Saccharobesus litoralis]|uniref:Uncharacterized protein n=1 Tax=Saccharobesus litoralis TaxID=2172099 RepID=A0A2S0VX25_9ALTE|nr:hypothetical protein C2869_21010 [Saccharobesus litoralis]
MLAEPANLSFVGEHLCLQSLQTFLPKRARLPKVGAWKPSLAYYKYSALLVLQAMVLLFTLVFAVPTGRRYLGFVRNKKPANAVI